jgi:hypothetical protein
VQKSVSNGIKNWKNKQKQLIFFFEAANFKKFAASFEKRIASLKINISLPFVI